MRPKISIIVPIYNIERYIRRCLDSIQSQTFKEWECILVDDGSTDSSGNICDEYSQRDARFIVIHRQNGGPSAARNSGLKLTHAELIGFVDPDDYLHPRMYEELYKLITEYKADMVQTGFVYSFKGYHRKKTFVKRLEILKHDEILIELVKSATLTNHMCNKLFRREVIISPFPEEFVYAEDMLAMSIWAKNLQKVILSPSTHYFYRKRKASITHTVTLQNQINHLTARFQQIDRLTALAPMAISESQITYYKWKKLIDICKYTARNITDFHQAAALVNEIRENCLNLPRPTKEHLGAKLYKRAKWLIDRPAHFVRIMRLSYKLDLHARFESHRLFD